MSCVGVAGDAAVDELRPGEHGSEPGEHGSQAVRGARVSIQLYVCLSLCVLGVCESGRDR